MGPEGCGVYLGRSSGIPSPRVPTACLLSVLALHKRGRTKAKVGSEVDAGRRDKVWAERARAPGGCPHWAPLPGLWQSRGSAVGVGQGTPLKGRGGGSHCTPSSSLPGRGQDVQCQVREGCCGYFRKLLLSSTDAVASTLEQVPIKLKTKWLEGDLGVETGAQSRVHPTTPGAGGRG